MAHHHAPQRTPQKQTSSFIFLHDTNSSSTHLTHQLTHALHPKTTTDILSPQTNTIFLNAPIQTSRLPSRTTTTTTATTLHSTTTTTTTTTTTPPTTPPTPPQEPQQHTWFSTTHPVGADDAASPSSWAELSACLKKIDEAVMRECARFGRENVFIVGVGMGFAVGAAYVVQMEEGIGGLLGVGGWLPFHADLKRVAVHGEVTDLGELDFSLEKRREEKGQEEEEEKEDEEEDEDAFASGYSTPTLCDLPNPHQPPTPTLMLQRTKAFLEHVLLRGRPPSHPRICNRIDASTPVLLVHGADDKSVPFTYAKEAQETLRHFGFEASLRVVEGETHAVSRGLLGELMDGFMGRGLGNGCVRGAVGEMLLGGWL